MSTAKQPYFSFTSLISKNNDIVYDLRAKINGEARYFIVKIDKLKDQLFLNAIKSNKSFRLEDFGKILHRGWDEPEYEVKEKYNKLYGIYPDIKNIP